VFRSPKFSDHAPLVVDYDIAVPVAVPISVATNNISKKRGSSA
jgi:hypothetical protein